MSSQQNTGRPNSSSVPGTFHNSYQRACTISRVWRERGYTGSVVCCLWSLSLISVVVLTFWVLHVHGYGSPVSAWGHLLPPSNVYQLQPTLSNDDCVNSAVFMLLSVSLRLYVGQKDQR